MMVQLAHGGGQSMQGQHIVVVEQRDELARRQRKRAVRRSRDVAVDRTKH